MSKSVRNGIIAFSIVFVVSAFFGAMGVTGLSAIGPSMGLGFAFWFVITSLSNNKKVTNLTEGDRAEALAAAPPAGSAFLFVYREGFVGKMAGIDVTLDGRQVAQLKSPRMTRLTVTAGTHRLVASNPGIGNMKNKPAEVDVNLAAGERAVYRMSMKMGAIQGSFVLEREPNLELALAKLSQITMVKADQTPVAPPPPPSVTPASYGRLV